MSDQERHCQAGTMPEPLCRNIEAGSETLRMPDSDVDEIVTDNADVAGIRIGVRINKYIQWPKFTDQQVGDNHDQLPGHAFCGRDNINRCAEVTSHPTVL